MEVTLPASMFKSTRNSGSSVSSELDLMQSLLIKKYVADYKLMSILFLVLSSEVGKPHPKPWNWITSNSSGPTW